MICKMSTKILKITIVGLNHFNDPKAFIEYSNDMQDVYKNIEDYNPIKKQSINNF